MGQAIERRSAEIGRHGIRHFFHEVGKMAFIAGGVTLVADAWAGIQIGANHIDGLGEVGLGAAVGGLLLAIVTHPEQESAPDVD